MENNKQLGPLYQMETFSDPVVKNLSPPMHTITTLKLQHNFVFCFVFFLNCLFRSSVSSQITLQQELFHLPAGVCYKSPSPERSQNVMDGVAGHQEKKKKKNLCIRSNASVMSVIWSEGILCKAIIECFNTDGRWFTQNVPGSWLFIVGAARVRWKLVCSWFVPFINIWVLNMPSTVCPTTCYFQ